MARSYSLDLRERVVAAVAAGQSCRAVAGTFKVSVASVVKWSQRFRATGSAAAKKRGWQRPYAVAGEREWLLARLAEKPDLTLRALQAELAERGAQGELLRGLALLRARRHQLQKKACTPASRIGQTWQDGAHSGRSIKGGLILRTWCSSTRLGPRPT
jgi:transposase